MTFELGFFRNFKNLHLCDALDMPPYQGNKGKYLRVSEDENGIIYSDIQLTEKAIDENVFEIENGKIYIKDFISKSDAKNEFANIRHSHKKEDIENFVETDYVHTSGNELVSGEKVFSDKITFNGQVIFNSKTIRVETQNSYFKDKIVTIADSNDDIKPDLAGFEVYRGFDKTAKMLWDEQDKAWKVGTDILVPIALEPEIKTLQNEIDKNIKSIKDLTNKVDENTQKISVNSNQIGTLSTRSMDLKNKLTQLTNNYFQLKDKADKYFAIINEIQNIIDNTEVLTLKEGEDTISLKYDVYTGRNYSIFRNGILQDPKSDYILNNNKIQFKDKAENGDDKIVAQYSYKKDNK